MKGDPFLGLFDRVAEGDRVRLFYGPMHGEDFATVTGKGEHRWGRFVTCRIDGEDGREDVISGFTEIGIGTYYLGPVDNNTRKAS